MKQQFMRNWGSFIIKTMLHNLKYQQDFNSKAHSKMQRTVPLCIFWIIWQERSSSVFFFFFKLLNSPIMSFNNSYHNPWIIGLPHW